MFKLKESIKAKRIFRTLIILLILMINVGCDQVSKGIIRHKIDYHQKISLMNNHFTITRVENTGAFLSLGDSLPEPFNKILLTFFPIIALGFGLYYLFAKNRLSSLQVMGLCLVVGGGLGNIYDRLIHGSVTDFLHINFILFQTGIFNLADFSIMTGMFIILYDTYMNRAKLKAATSN